MSVSNKEILQSANQAISQGDYEGFISFCAEDSVWTFVGEQTLKGIQEIRHYIQSEYLAPPKFDVQKILDRDDHVVATGRISIKQADGGWKTYDYCDIWKFHDGKMSELKAFVIEDTNNPA